MCPKQQSFKISVTVVLEEDTVGYHASCPGFKGLHVTGKSKKEALENVKDAISCYLLSLIKHGDPIPFGSAVHARIMPHAADEAQVTSCQSHARRRPSIPSRG